MSQDAASQADVLEELDGLAGGGDVLQRVCILRAADVFWNPERVPVLCHMQGDEMRGDSPRILVKPHGREEGENRSLLSFLSNSFCIPFKFFILIIL